MKTQLKLTGVSFKRYMEHNILRHSIELHLDGEIPPLGLGNKEIIKLIKQRKKIR